jgi:hypothetical protein
MIPATLSAVCLAIMVILDQLMMKDIYNNSPAQAIIVSSVGGTFFGLLSTFIWWIIDPNAFTMLAQNALLWWYPYGLLIVIAGGISSQVLHQYFICFSKNADCNIVASWLAAAPIFVYITVILLETSGLLQTKSLYSLSTIAGVLLTTAGLHALERVTSVNQVGPAKYQSNIVMFLVLSVIYIILIDWTLDTGAEVLGVSTSTLTMTLLPWFWIGFLYGARTALNKEHRATFRANWSTVKQFALPILLLEVIGMYVFFFEFVGLGELDSVSIALITGLHAVVVWIASVGLGVYSRHIVSREESFVTVWKLQISKEALQQFALPISARYKQAACVLVIMAGILLFF